MLVADREQEEEPQPLQLLAADRCAGRLLLHGERDGFPLSWVFDLDTRERTIVPARGRPWCPRWPGHGRLAWLEEDPDGEAAGYALACLDLATGQVRRNRQRAFVHLSIGLDGGLYGLWREGHGSRFARLDPAALEPERGLFLPVPVRRCFSLDPASGPSALVLVTQEEDGTQLLRTRLRRSDHELGVVLDRGQVLSLAFSPSGARLAYAVCRGGLQQSATSFAGLTTLSVWRDVDGSAASDEVLGGLTTQHLWLDDQRLLAVNWWTPSRARLRLWRVGVQAVSRELREFAPEEAPSGLGACHFGRTVAVTAGEQLLVGGSTGPYRWQLRPVPGV